jgi:hypothetical protein
MAFKISESGLLEALESPLKNATSSTIAATRVRPCRPLKQTPKIGRPDLDDDAVAEFDAVPSSCFGPCRRSAFDRSMQSY